MPERFQVTQRSLIELMQDYENKDPYAITDTINGVRHIVGTGSYRVCQDQAKLLNSIVTRQGADASEVAASSDTYHEVTKQREVEQRYE